MRFRVIEPELNEEDTLSVRTFESLLGRSYGRTQMRVVADSNRSAVSALKAELVNTGLTSLFLMDEEGNDGSKMVVAACLSQLSGRHLVPLGLLTLHLISSYLLSKSIREPLKRVELIEELGVKVVTPLLNNRLQLVDKGSPQASLSPADGKVSVNGLVLDLDVSDLVLLPVLDDGVTRLFLIESSSIRRFATPVQFIDLTSTCQMVRGELDVKTDEIARYYVKSDQILEDVAHSSILLAAEALGCAERLLEMTVEHLMVRETFGKKVASYQAIKHRCSDLLVRIEELRATVLYNSNSKLRCLVSKALAGEVVTHVALEAIQLHGGVGFTWDNDTHLYLRRGKVCDNLVIDSRHARELLSRIL
ncbi:MAG: acyl-CoA dehydrogenase family protein [Aigarchaeota archaeon]|nr:acyl-CoA dehydrogenase family protein [Aigarchaeota archaeon]MDW8092866.1 acyl-CoA dehydrogenase [Nitrososphaerota archaeon]